MAMTAADGPWLHAWYDPVAGLKTFTQLIRMADLSNENDHRLLVADQDKRLKVYRGTGVSSVHNLVDTPVALAVFYPDGSNTTPRLPSVAVAAGPYVYVYRNLRPYLKFSLPSLAIAPEETAAWEAIYAGTTPLPEVVKNLTALRDAGKRLSSRALDLLVLPPGKERDDLVESTRGKPLVQQTVVTCMEVMYTDREGPGEASTLLVGTEAAALHFLDGTANGIEATVELPSVPVQIVVHGTKKGEHRVNILCRDGGVYAVRDRALLPTRLDAGAMPVAITRTDSEVILAGMDGRLTAFEPKGKKTWSVALPSTPTALCRMMVKRDRVFDCVAVACEGGLIRVFNGRLPVADLQAPDTVAAMRFGQYGRETNTLCFITRSGSLTFKMMRRTANFDSSAPSVTALPEQDVPIPVPKKTRLYLEQAGREKESASEIHRLFQRDLVKLRLSTTRAYVKSLKDGGASLLLQASGGAGGGAGSAAASVRLNASVQGLGPRFRIRLELQNVGSSPIADLVLVLLFNHTVYACTEPCMLLPQLLPGVTTILHLPLLCVDEGGGADIVRVHVARAGSAAAVDVPAAATPGPGPVAVVSKGPAVVPLITASINMPLSQPPQPIA